MGTMQDIKPSFAVDSVAKMLMRALRAKSPLPPMPLSILLPIWCVEFTLP